MNKKLAVIKISLIIFSLLYITACKEAITDPPAEINNKNFFPNIEGSYYSYNISVFDSTGQINSGTRSSYFQGDTIIEQTPYQRKIDSLDLNGNLLMSNIYLRKSQNGVFAFFDTTGFTSIVPDSLRNLLSVNTEYRLLYFPLSVAQTWPVYNVSINLGVSRIDIVNINAEVIENDSITISFRDTTITREVFKIKLKMEIITDIDLTTVTYNATAWIAEDTGFYKWEGDAELLNFISGTAAYLPGTIVLEELTAFSIP